MVSGFDHRGTTRCRRSEIATFPSTQMNFLSPQDKVLVNDQHMIVSPSILAIDAVMRQVSQLLSQLLIHHELSNNLFRQGRARYALPGDAELQTSRDHAAN